MPENDPAVIGQSSGSTACSMASIVDELKHLMRAEVTAPEHDCSAAEVAGAVCMLLGEIILKDDSECEKLGDWEQEIRELRCKIIGEHVWEFDQCGYWGHQYCLSCNQQKYPELGKLRCSEAIAKIGRIEELEYVPSP